MRLGNAPVWWQRRLHSLVVFLVGAVAVFGVGQTWVQAAAVNVFFVNVMQRGIADSSLDTLASAAPLAPERLAWQLGIQALARGDHARAIGVLEGGLQHYPTHAIMRVLLGQAYYETGNHEAAIAQWERVGASQILYAKGDQAQEQERFEEAIRFLESSLRVAPVQPHAHYFLAYAYYRLGDAERAIAEAQESIRLDGGHNLGYCSKLAWIYEMTGSLDLAYQEYRLILSLAPDNRAARESLIRVEKKLQEEQ